MRSLAERLVGLPQVRSLAERLVGLPQVRFLAERLVELAVEGRVVLPGWVCGSG
jgi:hypothetical protein